MKNKQASMPILAILQTPEIEVHRKFKFHKCKLLCMHNIVLKEVFLSHCPEVMSQGWNLLTHG